MSIGVFIKSVVILTADFQFIERGRCCRSRNANGNHEIQSSGDPEKHLITKQKTEGGQRSGRAEEAGYKPAAEGSS